jgi:hypothetical protein
MAKQLGDFTPGALIRFMENTRDSNRALITWAGSPGITVYKDNGSVENATGATVAVDFDGRAGLHLFTIDTTVDPAFYAFGSSFVVVASGGTVAGIPAAGNVVAEFTLGQTGEEVDAGIPQAMSSTSTTLRAAASFGDNTLAGRTILGWGSDQGYWVRADISGNTGDVVAHSAWRGGVTPTGTLRRYRIIESTQSIDLDQLGLSGGTTLGARLDTINGRIGAPVGASISADVAAVKVDTAAVKSKTDSLNFNLSGQVDANTRSMNGAAVIGNGTSGNRWRGA